YKFIFSQQTDFISSVSYDLESSSYDAFVRLFLKLSRPNDFLDDFNPDSNEHYTPLLERCRKGDIILKARFSEIYTERKILSLLHQKG
ncbi:hypothetical protein SB749_19695, partial [Brevibacterium sp. SIMBA_078]|uniref:hypothetical protein n=1 Tax=Brevibacterium sp. SIMBA_078 TaxID=3085816 RepID=UPI00397DE315